MRCTLPLPGGIREGRKAFTKAGKILRIVRSVKQSAEAEHCGMVVQ
jgi:hypothetical protein